MAIFKKGVSKMRISRLVADGAYGAFRLLIVPEAGVHNVKSEHYWYKWAVQAFDDRAWFSSVECHPMPEARPPPPPQPGSPSVRPKSDRLQWKRGLSDGVLLRRRPGTRPSGT